MRKFEKEVNAQERNKLESHQQDKLRTLQGQIEHNREEMRGLMSKFTGPGRRFYEAMRQVSDQKLKDFGKRNVGEAGFFVEALTQNSSNREGYADQRNNWGKHQGRGK